MGGLLEAVTGRLLLLWLMVLAGCAPPSPPVRSAGPAQRIVSLTPSLTELLFELGAGPRVVGVTRNDSFPPEVKGLPRVGDMQLDYEALLSLQPDLVVYDAAFNPEQGERLKSLGVNVLALNSASLEGLEETLLRLGNACGTLDRAGEVLEAWKKSLQAVRSRAAALKQRPRVFVEIWGQPLMTAGRGTFADQLVTLAGGQNLYADRTGYPNISPESLLQRAPDLIVLTVSTEAEARSRPGWRSLRARVHRINSDLLVRPTLRCLQAVRQLQDWFEE